MRATRRAIGLWTFFAAGLPLFCAQAATCRPAVTLEGEAELVGSVAQALQQRGIDTVAGPGCPLLRARVERRGSWLSVSISEEVRHAERLLASAEGAATLIESFARSDISAPLLLGHPVAGMEKSPAPPAVAPLLAVSPPAAPSPGAVRYTAGLLLEAAGGNDGSFWLGASVHLCARIGRFCLGALARVAAQVPELISGFDQILRLSTEALLLAELPLRLGRVTLLPGLGFGVGWLYSGASVSGVANSGGLRAEARLVAGVPLHRGLTLDLGLVLSGAFPGNNNFATDPGDPDHDHGVLLPAAPFGFLRGVVGLSFCRP